MVHHGGQLVVQQVVVQGLAGLFVEQQLFGNDVLFTALLKICYENMDMDGKMVFWEDMLENNSLEWRDVE